MRVLQDLTKAIQTLDRLLGPGNRHTTSLRVEGQATTTGASKSRRRPPGGQGKSRLGARRQVGSTGSTGGGGNEGYGAGVGVQ